MTESKDGVDKTVFSLYGDDVHVVMDVLQHSLEKDPQRSAGHRTSFLIEDILFRPKPHHHNVHPSQVTDCQPLLVSILKHLLSVL